jgi:hypothetical protein
MSKRLLKKEGWVFDYGHEGAIMLRAAQVLFATKVPD